MTDLLDQFLAEYGLRPWQWGEVDCCLVMCDWVIANGKPDPAPAWRGVCRSEADWKYVITERGGLHMLVGDVFARAGFECVTVPSRGVVGVIGAAHNIERQWGAIFDGHKWQVRLKDGFQPLSAHALAIWKF